MLYLPKACWNFLGTSYEIGVWRALEARLAILDGILAMFLCGLVNPTRILHSRRQLLLIKEAHSVQACSIPISPMKTAESIGF